MRRSSLSRRRHTPTVARRLRGGKRGSTRRSQTSVKKVRGGTTIPAEMQGENLVKQTIMHNLRQDLIEKEDQAKAAFYQAQAAVDKAYLDFKEAQKEAQTAYDQVQTAFEKADKAYKEAQTAYDQAEKDFHEADKAYKEAHDAVVQQRGKYVVKNYNDKEETYTLEWVDESGGVPDVFHIDRDKDDIYKNYSVVACAGPASSTTLLQQPSHTREAIREYSDWIGDGARSEMDTGHRAGAQGGDGGTGASESN